MKTLLFSGALLLAASTLSAQNANSNTNIGTKAVNQNDKNIYLHIELEDGTVHDYDSKSIKNMFFDTYAPTTTPDNQISINGHTYTKTVGGTVGNAVDLDLPSGTLWADHNIGARYSEESGAYFGWGEVGAMEEGYINGMKYKDENPYYGFNNLKYSTCSSDEYDEYDKFSKYVTLNTLGEVDDNIVLKQEDDAAVVNWGNGWVTPTIEQMEELCNPEYTSWTYIKKNGVHGYEVMSLQNGNTIFLPSAGRYLGEELNSYDLIGTYSTSSVIKDKCECRHALYFNNGRISTENHYSRGYGFCIRPVRYK